MKINRRPKPWRYVITHTLLYKIHFDLIQNSIYSTRRYKLCLNKILLHRFASTLEPNVIQQILNPKTVEELSSHDIPKFRMITKIECLHLPANINLNS